MGIFQETNRREFLEELTASLALIFTSTNRFAEKTLGFGLESPFLNYISDDKVPFVPFSPFLTKYYFGQAYKEIPEVKNLTDQIIASLEEKSPQI